MTPQAHVALILIDHVNSKIRSFEGLTFPVSGTGIRQISHRFMSQTGLLLLSLILQILRFRPRALSSHTNKSDPITLLHSFAIKSSMFNGDCLSPNIDNGHAFLSHYVMLPTKTTSA